MFKNQNLKLILRYFIAICISMLVVFNAVVFLSSLMENDLISLGEVEDIAQYQTDDGQERVYEPFTPTNPEAVFEPGIYYNINSYDEFEYIDLIPNVIFYEDGTVDIVENSFGYMGHCIGKYVVEEDGHTITCYIETADVVVPDIVTFSVDDDGLLVLRDTLHASKEGIHYVKDLV